MSPNEAAWLSAKLKGYSSTDLSPMINLGSSTDSYRKVDCPYIDKELFSPLVNRGVRVIHADLKDAQGVDFVGDLLDPVVRSQIRKLGVRSILCNNMLEHVTDIGAMCNALQDISPVRGILGLSVPHRYPYHPDPIDNGFRPDLGQLEELMRQYGYKLIDGEIISFGNYGQSLFKNPRLLIRDVYLLLTGLFRWDKWRVLFGNYRYLFKSHKVTCAIFESGS